MRALGLVLYADLVGLGALQFARPPTGFVPEQDQAYLITLLQLPPGATLDRTRAVLRQTTDIILAKPGVADAVHFVGLDAT